MTDMNELPQIIRDTIDDLVTDFLVCDRKGDEELPIGDIEQLVSDDDGMCTRITNYFSHSFHKAVHETDRK